MMRVAGCARTGAPSFNRGFTLLELIVVMTIVALLASIAAPRYFDSIDRARDRVLMQNLNVLRDAIDKFHTDTGAYPTSLSDLAAKRYVRKVPEDPVTGSLNAGLALWLIDEGLLPSRYVASQGAAVGRAGRVTVSAEADGTWIGGRAVIVLEGTAALD
jgi:general secretion pathway protein G